MPIIWLLPILFFNPGFGQKRISGKYISSSNETLTVMILEINKNGTYKLDENSCIYSIERTGNWTRNKDILILNQTKESDLRHLTIGSIPIVAPVTELSKDTLLMLNGTILYKKENSIYILQRMKRNL